MSNRPWRVKPSEIARTVKSIQQTGLNVRSVEVAPDGLIRVIVGEPEEPLARDKSDETSEWD